MQLIKSERNKEERDALPFTKNISFKIFVFQITLLHMCCLCVTYLTLFATFHNI